MTSFNERIYQFRQRWDKPVLEPFPTLEYWGEKLQWAIYYAPFPNMKGTGFTEDRLRRILAVYADKANIEYESCAWPSVKTVSELIDVKDEAKVRKGIRQLEALGLITPSPGAAERWFDEKDRPEHRRSNVYRVNFWLDRRDDNEEWFKNHPPILRENSKGTGVPQDRGYGSPTGPGVRESHRTGEGRSHRTPNPLDTNHYLSHDELTITPNSSNLGQKAHPIYAAKTSDEALDAIAVSDEDRRRAQRLIETDPSMRELKATHDHLQRGSNPFSDFPSSFGSFAG